MMRRRMREPAAAETDAMRWRLGPIGLVVLVVVGAGVGAAQDARFVAMDTLNVRDVLYHLSNGGGNTMALIDEINGGVVLIDTKRPGWGGAVQEAVGNVTDLPVTTIITTHANEDHAGSNGEFPDAGLIIAHENTAANMRRMALYAGGGPGLPTVTFTDRHTILEDLDRIDLYYFGPAHTDGDIVVVFAAKRTAYLGDLFPGREAPVIDTANGGSGIAFPKTLAAAVAAIDGIDRVISGHAPFPSTYAGRGRRERGAAAWTGWFTRDDLAEYADFNRAFLEAVEASHVQGLSAAEAAAALTLPERFADYDMAQAAANVVAIYAELAAR